jgi:hypothetical protein
MVLRQKTEESQALGVVDGLGVTVGVTFGVGVGVGVTEQNEQSKKSG